MKAKTIIQKISSILVANATVAAWSKGVVLRENDLDTAATLHEINVWPKMVNMEVQDGIVMLRLSIGIRCAVEERADDENVIAITSGIKGSMDIEHDIRTALMAYWPGLDCTCNEFTLNTTTFKLSGYDGAEFDLSCLYPWSAT